MLRHTPDTVTLTLRQRENTFLAPVFIIVEQGMCCSVPGVLFGEGCRPVQSLGLIQIIIAPQLRQEMISAKVWFLKHRRDLA